ncbi:hypothetical protein B9Z55_007601 [Caenorhabditis nigoni]|nr:hypothetical protein B9Z55_007601 [Caenorhabditis nigoni]
MPRRLEVLSTPDSIGVAFLLLVAILSSLFFCYAALRDSNVEYWIYIFGLVLLSIVIVKGVWRLEKKLNLIDVRERLIFGYSGILAYSILAQILLYFTDWRMINQLVFVFHTFHAGFLYLHFILVDIDNYVFHYGYDRWFHPAIIILLTVVWVPIVRIPELLSAHLYYNIIISLCYIDLSCVVRGYMNCSFQYEETRRQRPRRMESVPCPHTKAASFLMLVASIVSPIFCYAFIESNGEYWIPAFCLVLLSVLIVKGVLLLEKQLKDYRERLIFGYSGILAYSILAQICLYYTDWSKINHLVLAFHSFHSLFLYWKFLYEPLNQYIFHYGKDEFYHRPIMIVLTFFWVPMVREPHLTFIGGHMYYNFMIALFYIDLSCVVRGYMSYSFHYEEDQRNRLIDRKLGPSKKTLPKICTFNDLE